MDSNQTKLADSFQKNKIFNRLDRRRFTFWKMMEHLDKCEPGYIVETGCTRSDDNWEGDGQSTLIWDWVATETDMKFRPISIDITEEFIKLSESKTKKVVYECGDSVQTLNKFVQADYAIEQTRLIYLDSFDWSKEAHLDSSFHHMAELATVWNKLPHGCLIVVDDRHSAQLGKHFMVALFMEKLGIKPLFEEYQIGWIKV